MARTRSPTTTTPQSLTGRLGGGGPQPAIQMAILVISIVPILIVYPFLRRHFAKRVLTGAVKG
jgi:ABC-type glycerol-3-phosphate transport system permease component